APLAKRMSQVSLSRSRAPQSAPRSPAPSNARVAFFEHFARFGLAIKGIVYLIIGCLAALAPVGLSTRPTGTQGALATQMLHSAGSILVSVVAVGLLCFGIFQLLRAIDDPDRVGREWRGIFRRIGWA